MLNPLTPDVLPLMLAPGALQFDVFPACGFVDAVTAEGIQLDDRILRYRITASMDNPTITAEVTFATGLAATSLSPLMAGTSLQFSGGRPILAPGNEIILDSTVRVGGVSGVSGVFELFSGRVDRVSVGKNGEEVTVTCRDQGAFYLNRMIQQATKYGAAAGDAAEGVMQDILFDNGFNTLDLYVPSSPSFAIYEYAQQEMPVLLALRQIAQQFGWDVRWFPSDRTVTSNLRSLRLYDPGRLGGVGSLYNIFSAGRYESIDELAWGDEDVRNSWDVYWQDADGVVQTPVHVENTASIAAYGLRYARIYLNRAENIRSAGTALQFADAALADSKDPFASHVLRGPFLPHVELNDVHTYTANGVHYDTDQTFAVVAYTHEYAKGHATTTVGARGKPIAAYRDYRRSVPPRTIVSLSAPDDAIYAPENTIHIMTDSIAFP